MSHRGSFRFITNRHASGDDTPWETLGVCRDDPELHYPVGTSGPALLQIEQAKGNCRRCPVTDQCLQWALNIRDPHGVFGGTTPQERAAILSRNEAMAAA